MTPNRRSTTISDALPGVKMPAVLVGVGFLSNRDEARRLRSRAHRGKLARAIADGITRYTAR